MTFTTLAQIEAATTKEIIAFYNEHSTKPVTKFTNRATAVLRAFDLMCECGLLADSDEAEQADESASKEDEANASAEDRKEADKNFVWPFALTSTVSAAPKVEEDNTDADAEYEKSLAKGEAKPAKTVTKTVTNKTGGYASNSAGVAASWCDPSVAAARLTRDGVSVTFGSDVRTFKSTREAFRAFRLMDSKHIRFRAILKAAKTATYTENGKDYLFAIL